MKLKSAMPPSLITFLTAVLAAVLIGLMGCASTQEVETAKEYVAVAENPELDQLQDGLDAFARGDFSTALFIFEYLSRRTEDKVILRRALYGAATSRLALAKDESSLRQALAAWSQWERLATKELGFEDPLMLSPFLKQVESREIYTDPAYAISEAKSYNAEACQSALNKKQKDLQKLKVRLDSAQKDNEYLRNRIYKLRNQIDSLEAIHLEIQEKKKEVSSP